MGFFGRAHTDDNDDPAHFSHMSANSDLPEGAGYTPGYFFILQLGVFIVLDRHTSINFSGLRRHGGTPPLCPPTADGSERPPLYKFAVRFVIIHYPPRRMMNGTARWSLAAMPNNRAFIFPPEVLHAGVTNRIEKGWPAKTVCKRATFVREGELMMDPGSQVTFLVRCLLLLCHFFMLQLPSAYEMRLDPDLFLQAFTMKLGG
ncbi:hypothetical protein GGX14DRAFT_666597, partial [Mycena pura]